MVLETNVDSILTAINEAKKLEQEESSGGVGGVGGVLDKVGEGLFGGLGISWG
jgi:hypothetical protein